MALGFATPIHWHVLICFSEFPSRDFTGSAEFRPTYSPSGTLLLCVVRIIGHFCGGSYSTSEILSRDKNVINFIIV